MKLYLALFLAFFNIYSCFLDEVFNVKCNDVCKCTKKVGWTESINVVCPTDVEITFEIEYDEMLLVMLTCHRPQADLSVLSGINLTSILHRSSEVVMKGCYLPNFSLYDLLASKGITNYDSLRIVSYNGSLQRMHFENLHHVYTLEISKSNLGDLPADVFADLPNLSKLTLSFSSFSLSKGIFQYFLRLRMLYLTMTECNNYDVVFDQLEGLERLEIVATSTSALQLQPRHFADLMKIETIYISGMNLMYVPEDAFSGSKKLDTIGLINNLLTTVKENTFSDLEDLEELYLSHNKISHLPGRLFSRTKRLMRIYLNYNLLEIIEPNLFLNLNKLAFLDLSHNKFQYINGEQFSQLTSLDELYLSHNQLISLVQNPLLSDLDRSVFYRCSALTKLDLHNNSLREIYDDWAYQLPNLGWIIMSNNKITDLQILNITHGTTSTENETINGYSWLSHIDISENILNCDCDLLTSLFNLSRTYHIQETNEVTILQSATCKTPTRLENVKLINIDWSKEYGRCKQLSPEKDDKCPEGCRCVYRPLTRSSVINCQYSDLQTYPRTLPVAPHANHTELNLYGNRLREFRIPDDPGYKNVTFLNLANNSLSTLDISGVSKGLKKLDLRHNNLNTLSEETLELLENAGELERLELANNPWNCDVTNYRLAKLVHDKKHLIWHNVTCEDGSPVEKILELYYSRREKFTIKVAFSVVGTVLILTVLYYRNRQRVLVYCFSSRWKVLRWLVSHPDIDDDDDKLYDAFIVYAHEDELFVDKHLVPYLEENEERKYKLCLHYRDWIPGEQIMSQIGRSVRSSRRTIVVLSPNFLRSVWAVAEFRIAHAEALKDGTARVIVILYGEVADEEMDEELKAYLKTNTYVKWGSPWFWKQLTYALPHPPDRERGVLHYYSWGERRQREFHKLENEVMRWT